MHKPVLLDAVLSHLKLNAGEIVVDGTVGSGGYAEAIWKRIGPEGWLIGMDRDPQALERARKRLQYIGSHMILEHSNFLEMDKILTSLNLNQVHGVVLDLGLSTEQLEDPVRGFSFLREGPLDMRMDPTAGGTTAADIVERASEGDLSKIFWEFGEERYARRIARRIVEIRERKPIKTTRELKEVIERCVPRGRRFGRIHPATRVFQALRIAVNEELETLRATLPKAVERLRSGGRLATVSFHSLEDRIVKRFYLEQKNSAKGKIITRKPIRPTEEEISDNPRSRSAKLRVLERV